jgi:hypothetical protein
MIYTIFDAESDGLLDKVTKIHCLSYRTYEGTELKESGTITDYEQMRRFIKYQDILVGHNIIQYDVPLLEMILNIEVEAFLIDTLAISYYHYPIKNFKHGLKYWGEKLGYGKPVVEDWENQPIEVYINRCEADVEINTRLFHGQMDYTMAIYEDFDKVMELFGYLGFKMDCLKDQAEVGIPLDKSLAEKSKSDLKTVIKNKVVGLSKNMPPVIIKSPPKIMYKQSGEISAHGLKWFALLKELDLPEDSEAIYELGNPGSTPQLHKWLLGLGWIPETFKLSKSTGKTLSQVSLPFGAGLCPSVERMFEEHPFLEDLDGLYKAKHRFGLFKSFLENLDEDSKIYSRAHGLTNTLRLQHSKPCVNLPGVDKWYGKEVRGCLTVPNEDYIMCGSDISGLEDNTKQHYIYFYDSVYVDDMRVPGFDPHIDIAVLAGMLNKEDEVYFKWYSKLDDQNKENEKNNLEPVYIFTKDEKGKMKIIKVVRGQAKVVNFSATYGAGAVKISETLGCTLAFATTLHETYWSRNWAVKQTAKDCKVKKVKGQKWLYNPVSGFWYFLKAEKDRFSTLNQGTGVFVFDSWVRKVRQNLKPLGIKVCFQYHDELLLYCKKEYKNQVSDILNLSMKQTNEEIKLNVEIGISVDWGLNYADCH